VAKNCICALNQADLIFCYVDSLDCYGTLFELGRAVERDIPIVIALAPGLASPEKNQFWFMCEFATAVYFDVSEAKLGELFDWIIGRRQW
jgi:nucleoside 2-deoxyribosyltransferase